MLSLVYLVLQLLNSQSAQSLSFASNTYSVCLRFFVLILCDVNAFVPFGEHRLSITV